MKQSWIRKILGGISLTSALFVFQACYGTPQDAGLDLLIEGQVTSKLSGLPVEGTRFRSQKTASINLPILKASFHFIPECLKI